MESANWVINICSELTRLGHSVTCVVQELDTYEPIVSVPGLNIIKFEYDIFLNPKKFISNIKPHIAERFDIIFGSHVPTSPIVKELGNIYNSPWGIMVLDIPTDIITRDFYRRKMWATWFDTIKYADVIIFNTEIARDEFKKYTGFYISDKNVIPYATNFIPKYKLSGFGNDNNYVISVCRFVQQKNQIIIPMALSLLKNKIKYIGIGHGDIQYINMVREECVRHKIEFEHIQNITDEKKFEYIKNSSVLIYPQNTEYIGGLSPFEGLYVGKPTLVPDLPVHKSLFNTYPIYFKNNNPYSLAEKIIISKETIPNIEHVTRGANHANNVASYNTMVKNIINVIRETIGDKT